MADASPGGTDEADLVGDAKDRHVHAASIPVHRDHLAGGQDGSACHRTLKRRKPQAHRETFASWPLSHVHYVIVQESGQTRLLPGTCPFYVMRVKIAGGTNTMSMEREITKPERLNLEAIDASLKTVEMHWPQ